MSRRGRAETLRRRKELGGAWQSKTPSSAWPSGCLMSTRGGAGAVRRWKKPSLAWQPSCPLSRPGGNKAAAKIWSYGAAIGGGAYVTSKLIEFEAKPCRFDADVDKGKPFTIASELAAAKPTRGSRGDPILAPGPGGMGHVRPAARRN